MGTGSIYDVINVNDEMKDHVENWDKCNTKIISKLEIMNQKSEKSKNQ